MKLGVPTSKQRQHMRAMRPFKMRQRLYRTQKLISAIEQTTEPTTCLEHDYWKQKYHERQSKVQQYTDLFFKGRLDKWEFIFHCLDTRIAELLMRKPVMPPCQSAPHLDEIGTYDHVIGG